MNILEQTKRKPIVNTPDKSKSKRKAVVDTSDETKTKRKPSVSPVTDDETTKKVDSTEDLTSIRVTDIEDYPTDKLKIKLFRTRLTQEPKGFVRDYDFIEAIQKALENKDTNKNLSGTNFVPGW